MQTGEACKLRAYVANHDGLLSEPSEVLALVVPKQCLTESPHTQIRQSCPKSKSVKKSYCEAKTRMHSAAQADNVRGKPASRIVEERGHCADAERLSYTQHDELHIPTTWGIDIALLTEHGILSH
jgi:hypothetical protein